MPNKSRREDCEPNDLKEAVWLLVIELRGFREQWRNDNNKAVLNRIAEMEKRIMASQSEIAAQLRESAAQQKKTNTEIAALQVGQNTLLEKIAALEKIIADIGVGGEATQELVDAAAEVKAQAQANDDLIPDPVVPPPVP